MKRFGGLALLGPYLRPYRGRTVLALLSHVVTARTRAHLLALAAINRNQESVIAERTSGLKSAVEALEAGQQDARVAAAVFETTADGKLVNRWLTTGMLAASASSNETGYITHKFARSQGMLVFDNQARV